MQTKRLFTAVALPALSLFFSTLAAADRHEPTSQLATPPGMCRMFDPATWDN